jgi:ABC-type branched-subunit amino acid transport system permease subunit
VVHADIQLLIAGLADGPLAALLASGLIIKFRCSRVLDFSHGAVATLAGYMFIWAVTTMHWPTWVGIVLGIVSAAATSGLFQAFVIWPARAMPALSKLVASLGLMLVITSALPLLFGTPYQAVNLVSGQPIGLGFGRPEFLLERNIALVAVVTIVLTVALILTYKFTRFGRASVAISDNQRMTELLGYSSRRTELLNWILGGALAGLAGVLFSTLSAPSPISLTEVLMMALAIALVTGFRSFGGMLLVGFVVGLLQAIFLRYGFNLQQWTQLTGWGDAIPLTLIIVAMLVAGRSIASKGQGLERPLPDAPIARHPLRSGVIALVLGAIWLVVIPSGWVDASTEALIMTVMALSLVVLAGYTGQLSLAQLSLAGFGAYAAARTATVWHLAFPLPILIGAVAAVPFALVFGVAAVRVRGMSLAVATLAFAIVADDMFFNSGLTGASGGMTMPPTSVFGLSLDSLNHERALAGLVLVIAVLVSVAAMYLRRSALGLRMLAIRANERGAAASGIPVARTKLLAFTIGGAIAGLAGSLEAYREVQISWSNFSFENSILLLAFAFLAGTTYVSGAWLTGAIVNGGLLSIWLTFQGNGGVIFDIFAGFAVMAVVLLHPSGVTYDLKRLAALPAAWYRTAAERASSGRTPRTGSGSGDLASAAVADTSQASYPQAGD